MVELKRRLEEAERELRWAKEGRKSAESRERLVRQELDATRSTGGGSSGGGDAAHVQRLESLLETYRAEIEGLSRDSRDVEDRVTRGAGLVKADELAAAQERTRALEQELVMHQGTIDALTAANNSLDAEVSELMQRLASGEFNPERERCLELRGNPAAKIHAVRTAQLDELREENQALLARLADLDREVPDASAAGRGLVPRESYDKVAKEKEELEIAHEKRLRRLKEVSWNLCTSVPS
jgi:mitotic spindle assembly checkpoint protein MAD1